jgi:hypothetical protein
VRSRTSYRATSSYRLPLVAIMPTESTTARSVAWCSTSIWSAPDRSGFLTSGASSIPSDPDRSHGSVRVGLEEQVVSALPVDRPVGVVHPVALRGDVILGVHSDRGAILSRPLPRQGRPLRKACRIGGHPRCSRPPGGGKPRFGSRIRRPAWSCTRVIRSSRPAASASRNPNGPVPGEGLALRKKPTLGSALSVRAPTQANLMIHIYGLGIRTWVRGQAHALTTPSGGRPSSALLFVSGL